MSANMGVNGSWWVHLTLWSSPSQHYPHKPQQLQQFYVYSFMSIHITHFCSQHSVHVKFEAILLKTSILTNNNSMLCHKPPVSVWTSLLTLHWVDEVSVFAPYFSPEARVIVVVLQVGWAERRAPVLRLTLLLIPSLSAGRAILPGSFLISAASGSLHVWFTRMSCVLREGNVLTQNNPI